MTQGNITISDDNGNNLHSAQANIIQNNSNNNDSITNESSFSTINHTIDSSKEEPPLSPTSSNTNQGASSSIILPTSHWKSETPNTSNNKGKAKANDSNESSTNRPQAAFINKLYKMLEDDSIQHLINWSPNGDLFSVSSPTAFSKLVLPQYFKHNNWQSFVRQLNMYGFHKVNDMIHSNLTSESQKWEFRHQHFRRGAINELQNIKRKSAKSHHQYLSPTSSPVSTSSVGRLLLNTSSHQQSTQDQQQQQSNQQFGGNHGEHNLYDDKYSLDPINRVDQSNPIYHHILRLEDRVRLVSHSHTSLKNETERLKSILLRQQDAMQDIADVLLNISKYDSNNVHYEKVEKIRQHIKTLREAMDDGKRNLSESECQLDSSLKRKSPQTATTTSTFSFTEDSTNAPPPLSSARVGNNDNPNLNTYNNYINVTSTYRNDGMTTTFMKSDDHDTDNNNNSSNSSIVYRKSEPFLPMPISSILSSNLSPSPEHIQTSMEGTSSNDNRLPSIDLSHTGPFSSASSHHYPQYPTTTSPPMRAGHSLQPFQSLQPIRSLLEATELRPIGPSTESITETRLSPYMGLGKESPLMNPVDLRHPSYDNRDTKETKRRRKEH
ncbi:HSF-type DNA-binding-domain-containing protein [Halteromyces radiatus]|uniref:HSF-type DNA-binding-domain-containing protein n=1 Tax=Halteromyces radiatus TaxID=101107 RepID=UPI00221F5A61|nr:HSF-type DNA-binding-domain-containing protein [Halteromyces radiatus]KAI8098505.1 HSF-type DNA-binding-domain-containing protein [Halteromyces radiatus]